jgi:hypothetical protein
VLNDYLSQSHTTDGKLRADVATIAALKALDVSTLPDKMQVMVGGYYSHGDGGGGQFYYDQGASDTDNGGTIIAPTAGSGRWKRIYSGAVNVRWFGAKGDGVTDDTAAIGSAITAIKDVYIPIGTYKVSSTITIPDKGSITGDGRDQSILLAASISGAVLDNGSSFTTGQRIDGLKITGIATTGIKIYNCSPGYVGDVAVYGTFDYGFDFSLSFGCTFEYLSTDGATIGIAAFRVSNYFNANNCTHWYTQTSYIPIGVLFDTGNSCAGNVFNNLTLQGCVVGLQTNDVFVKGLTINGLYTEATVTAMSLGTTTATYSVLGLSVNGGVILGSGTHPQRALRSAQILLKYVIGASFNGIDFSCIAGSPRDSDAFGFKKAYNVVVNGCRTVVNDAAVSLENYIKFMPSASSDSDITLIGCSHVTGSANNTPSIIRRVDAAGYKFCREYLDTNGARVVSTFTMTAIETPPA